MLNVTLSYKGISQVMAIDTHLDLRTFRSDGNHYNDAKPLVSSIGMTSTAFHQLPFHVSPASSAIRVEHCRYPQTRRHPMLSSLAAILMLLLSGNGSSVLAQDLQTGSQLAQNWVQDVYQPAFRQFAAAASEWASSGNELCESTRGSRIYQLQTSFTERVADYSRVEIFRSGPLLQNNLRSRLFYWPDKRRAGERQLRALLADAELNDLSVQQLSGKSVALQGFSALERLLFNPSYQPVESMPQCHAVKIIMDNIARMAEELDQAWQGQSDFVQSFLSPEPTSEYFRSEDEVMRNVMTDVIVGLDSLIDRKIQPLLSGDPAIIRTAPLWQSRRTVSLLSGNLLSIRSLLFDSGMLGQMDLEEAFSQDFDYADYLLNQVRYRYRFLDDDGQLNEEIDLLFTSLSAVLNRIRYALKQKVLAPLGIGVAFNAEDGD